MNISDYLLIIKFLIDLIELIYQIYQDKKITATSANVTIIVIKL